MKIYKLEIQPFETLHTKFGSATIDKYGYYRIVSRKEGNYHKKLHRLIFEDFYGKIPKECVIHHKNYNKANNCIMNLQLLTNSEHSHIHNKGENNHFFGKSFSEEHKIKLRENHWDCSGENHPMYGKHHSQEVKKNMSKSKNTLGLFNVYKNKCSKCKQGFIFRYEYTNADGNRKTISRTDIVELEKAVKEKGLVWCKFEDKL